MDPLYGSNLFLVLRGNGVEAYSILSLGIKKPRAEKLSAALSGFSPSGKIIE